MSTRLLITAVSLLALSLVAPTEAFAQKTKGKGSDSTQSTTQNTSTSAKLDPSDPDDLEYILDEADGAYFTDNPDYKYAFEMYSLASEGGDAYATNRLALMYDRGEFVAQDYEKAFELYLQAAEAGLPAAQSNVGSMYDVGDGVAQSYSEALKWYRRAADNGYAYAMYAIGDMYLNGDGVAKDAEEATAWYKKASDNGDANGHWSLALRYLYGDGAPKDTQQAAELAYLALTKGLQIALDEFKAIADAETPVNFRRAMQQLLKADGYYTGAIDGSFGPATMRAIEAAFDTVN